MYKVIPEPKAHKAAPISDDSPFP